MHEGVFPMEIPKIPSIDITKIIEQFKLPGVDLSSIVEARRKDIEALTEVNKITLEAVQTMAKKQVEILQQTMQELQSATKTMAGNPLEGGGSKSEFVQHAFDKAFGYMRELAEVTRKSQTEALEVINNRVHENVKELKSLVQSKK
jgi:phasin family protein